MSISADSANNTEPTPASAGEKKKRKSKGRKKTPAKRASSGRRTKKEKDWYPPLFDVEEMNTIVGEPVWQQIHTSVIQEVKDDGVIVEVALPEQEPIVARIDRLELAGREIAKGESLVIRLLAPAKENEDGTVGPAEASYRQAIELEALESVRQALEGNTELTGMIVGEVRGGFSVALGAQNNENLDESRWVRAFLPKSHSVHPRRSSLFKEVVGTVDQFAIRELDLARANVVVSRKERLAAEHAGQVDAFWSSVKVGDVVQGEVRALVPFGAFVDVGGVDGLLHVSDLVWDRPPAVNQVVKVGDRIEVMVLVAERAENKLKLGLKQLTPNPWEELSKKVNNTETIDGVVVALSDYGAFVRLEEGIEGLVHMSELSWDKIKHPSQAVQIGDEVTAKVLDVDVENQRLSLSLKATQQNPFEKIAEEWPAGTVLKANVKSITDFGAFVQLAGQIDGLVHVGEISWTQRVNHPSELLEIGQEVEVVVLRIDVARQRVACSIRQAQENPWTQWEEKFRDRVRGMYTCSRVADQGAYFDLGDDLTGFCHVRDLSPEHIERASEVIKTGQEIELEIKNLDRNRLTVLFSAKSIIEEDTKRAYQEYKDKEQQEADSRLTLGDAIGAQLGQSHLENEAGEAPSDVEHEKTAGDSDGSDV